MAFTKRRADWVDWPSTLTPVVGNDYDAWEQAMYDLSRSNPQYMIWTADDGLTYAKSSVTGLADLSGSDPALVYKNAMSALVAAPYGGMVALIGPLAWQTVPTIPNNIGTGQQIRTQGFGAKITLSSAAPRFIDFNRTADNQTFRNFEIDDLLIDNNNVGGRHHVVMGTYMNGTTGLQRVNFDNISVRRVKTINVPTDAALVNHRLNFWLTSIQPTLAEVTQNTTTRILVEDCDFQGGNSGAEVAGICAAGNAAGLNIYVDDITFRRVKHVLGTVPTSLFSSSNFQIASVAQGGRCLIENCYGQNSGDVGIEIDAMADTVIKDTTIKDAFAAGFYHANFNNPPVAATQQIKLIGCNASRENATSGVGYKFANENAIGLGAITLRDCSWYRSTPDVQGNGVGDAIDFQEAVIAKIDIDGFRSVVENVNYSYATDITYSMIRLATATTNLCHVRLRNLDLSITGQHTGIGVFNPLSLVGFQGKQVLDADGIEMNVAVTGLQPTGIRAILFSLAGGTRIYGKIRHPRVVGFSDDTAPRAVYFGSTASFNIDGRFIVADGDFSAMTGGVEVFFSDNTNQPKVHLINNLWRTFPKPSAAMGTANFTTATFATGVGNQYIGGSPAEIHFATGTGHVTSIATSKDGVTYEQVYAQASAAMAQDFMTPVDNGDFVKVTDAAFAQPTTRVRFRK